MKKAKTRILVITIILFAILLMICKYLDNRRVPDLQEEPETTVSTESAPQKTVPAETEPEEPSEATETTPATETTTAPTETAAPTVPRKPSYSGSSGTSTGKETTPPATSPPATSPPASEPPTANIPELIPGEDETPGDLL